MVELKQTFNAGASILSESIKPVKESVVSMLQLQTDNGQHKSRMSIDLEKVSRFTDNDHEQSPGSDKYPAPSTPKLKQGARLVDDGDCQEQTNCSTVKESGEHDGESNSIETTCGNLNAETESTPQPRKSKKIMVKEEEDFADHSKDESVVSPNPRNIKVLSNTDGNTKSPNKVGVLSNSCEIKANRKKVKVDWTPELHKKSVKAVEQLGIDQAIPSRILDLTKVEGLTRHNVASHLQKYRMNKRQILPKEEDQKWLNLRDPVQRTYCLKRPIMAFPPYHSNHTLSPAPVYPMWGQSGSQMFGMQIWGPPGYPLWQPTESWHWKPFPVMHADAWVCPVLPPPQAPCFSYSQNMPVFHNANAVDYKFCMPQSSFEHYLTWVIRTRVRLRGVTRRRRMNSHYLVVVPEDAIGVKVLSGVEPTLSIYLTLCLHAKAANLYQGHFLIKNSKYLVRAQDLLNKFCSLGTKQSDVVKQKSQKNKQWEEDNVAVPQRSILLPL